jgi:hypothetical protein
VGVNDLWGSTLTAADVNPIILLSSGSYKEVTSLKYSRRRVLEKLHLAHAQPL